MASKMLRRSGVSVGLVAECLKWKADVVYQVGVGVYHEEVDVLREEWGCRFVGCEPHRGTYESVKGSYPGRLHNVAIANTSGIMTFYQKKRHADGSSLNYHDLLKTEEREKISSWSATVATLDGMFERDPVENATLLWLDCEGSELDALRGSEKFLHRVQVINVEVAYNPPGSGWCSPIDIQEFLANRGFFACWAHTARISSGQCDFVYVRKWLFDPHYCCFPWEVKRFREECDKYTT
jgi:FkbM family methyltransferase